MLVVLSGQEGQKRDQARHADHNHRSPDVAAGRWLLNRLVPYRSQYRQLDSSKAHLLRAAVSAPAGRPVKGGPGPAAAGAHPQHRTAQERVLTRAPRIAATRRGTGRYSDLVPRHPTFALSPAGICVARSTRVEEDGFAGGPSVGCAGGPLP